MYVCMNECISPSKTSIHRREREEKKTQPNTQAPNTTEYIRNDHRNE